MPKLTPRAAWERFLLTCPLHLPVARTLCALVLAAGVAGCGSSAPSAPALSNPQEIVNGSLTALAAASAVHVEGTVDGSVNAAALSALAGASLGLSGNLKLDGATFAGDVDIRNQALQLTATFPSLFGTKVDLIAVDGFTYTRINTFGPKYSKQKAEVPALSSAAPGGAAASIATLSPAAAIEELRTELGSAISSATLVGHDSVGGRDAYHVSATVPADVLLRQMAEMLGGASTQALGFDLAPVDYWVYSDGLEPAKLALSATSTSLGSLKVTVTLTKYGQSVQIQAPPDSEIEAG